MTNREAEDMVEEVTMITDADVHHHAGNSCIALTIYANISS